MSFRVPVSKKGDFSETSDLRAPRGYSFLFSHKNTAWEHACVLSKQGLLVQILQAYMFPLLGKV